MRWRTGRRRSRMTDSGRAGEVVRRGAPTLSVLPGGRWSCERLSGGEGWRPFERRRESGGSCVTSIPARGSWYGHGRSTNEVYCARGEMVYPYLHQGAAPLSVPTSCGRTVRLLRIPMQANQLRLYFASFAYVMDAWVAAVWVLAGTAVQCAGAVRRRSASRRC